MHRPTDPEGHQSAGRAHVLHTSGPSIKKHWRTTAIGTRLPGPSTPMTLPRAPPCPPPTPLSARLRAPLSTSTARQRRFPGRLSQPPPALGPCRHPPTMRLSRRTREPPRHRTGPGPFAHDHHATPATSGTPAWWRTTAKQPPPPSCPGGHTVKSGACDARTVRVGYCFNVCMPVFMCLTHSECF